MYVPVLDMFLNFEISPEIFERKSEFSGLSNFQFCLSNLHNTQGLGAKLRKAALANLRVRKIRLKRFLDFGDVLQGGSFEPPEQRTLNSGAFKVGKSFVEISKK